jgi:hypothetical protein
LRSPDQSINAQPAKSWIVPGEESSLSDKLPDDKLKCDALPDDEIKCLDKLAQWTIAYLVAVCLGSFFLAYLLLVKGFPEIAPIALFGFAGSAVAALTSCLDRYAVGFERGDGKPYPESIKDGEGKFNRRFARWLFVRPFLGSVIAPVFVWGLSHFAGDPQKWSQTLGFTAFMGGLLAKSVVDLIKGLFKNVFHV